MKNLYKQKRQQGFTIIEVMIVLAIAAVILLIVLLAVPALQRNSRNTQRNNDAATLAAAVNTCLSNNNGLTANCNAIGPTKVDIPVVSGVATKMGQLQTVTYTSGIPANDSTAFWQFNKNCNAAGTGYGTNPTPRGFAV